MYIIKYLDGTLKEAPELDPNHPDRELMGDSRARNILSDYR